MCIRLPNQPACILSVHTQILVRLYDPSNKIFIGKLKKKKPTTTTKATIIEMNNISQTFNRCTVPI